MLEETRLENPPEGEAELNLRIAQAVEAARGNWEKDLKTRVDEARAEGERVAGMSYEEKLAAREKELQGRERALSRRELRAMAAQTLSEKGLPGELADAINCEDGEAFEASFQKAESAFRAAVQAGIARRLGGMAPALGLDAGDPAKLTDDQYYAGKFGK